MRRFGVLILAGLVAACSSSTKETVLAPCPRVTILADGADVTRFRPGAPPDFVLVAAQHIEGPRAHHANAQQANLNRFHKFF